MKSENKRPEKGRSTLLFPDDYTVIDIETTGLSPCRDAIIELSAIRVEGNEVSDSFTSLVNPGFHVSSFISSLTGITDDMLVSSPVISEALPLFLDFVGESHIVGHNVNFDINFIYDNSLRILSKPFSNSFTDTMRLSRLLLDLPHNTLSDLSGYYCVSYEGAHRALTDCTITRECFRRLREDATRRFPEKESFNSFFN